MSPADTVSSAKEKVVQVLGPAATSSVSKLSLVEVFDHHISRVVDDWVLLRHLKEDRQVYIVEVLGAKDEEGSRCDMEDAQVSSSSSDEAKELQGTSGKSSSNLLEFLNFCHLSFFFLLPYLALTLVRR